MYLLCSTRSINRETQHEILLARPPFFPCSPPVPLSPEARCRVNMPVTAPHADVRFLSAWDAPRIVANTTTMMTGLSTCVIAMTTTMIAPIPIGARRAFQRMDTNRDGMIDQAGVQVAYADAKPLLIRRPAEPGVLTVDISRRRSSARMPDGQITGRREALRPDLAHRGGNFLIIKSATKPGPCSAQRTQPVHERAAGRHELRTQSHRPHHINAAADAAVEHHF